MLTSHATTCQLQNTSPVLSNPTTQPSIFGIGLDCLCLSFFLCFFFLQRLLVLFSHQEFPLKFDEIGKIKRKDHFYFWIFNLSRVNNLDSLNYLNGVFLLFNDVMHKN